MKKIYLSAFLSAIILTACQPSYDGKFDYENYPGLTETYAPFSQKADGQTLWGVKNLLNGRTVVPPRYEKLRLIPEHFFEAELDGKKYLLDSLGQEPFKNYSHCQSLDGASFSHNGFIHLVHTTDGIGGILETPFGSCFGPYQKFFPGIYGFVFEEKGYYGYYRQTLLTEVGEVFRPKLVLKPEYDRVYEYKEGGASNFHCLYAQKDNRWYAFDLDGKSIRGNKRMFLLWRQRAIVYDVINFSRSADRPQLAGDEWGGTLFVEIY